MNPVAYKSRNEQTVRLALATHRADLFGRIGSRHSWAGEAGLAGDEQGYEQRKAFPERFLLNYYIWGRR